jgi:hypothetical protein
MAEERLATADNKAEQEAARAVSIEKRLITTAIKAAVEAMKLTQRDKKRRSATGLPRYTGEAREGI